MDNADDELLEPVEGESVTITFSVTFPPVDRICLASYSLYFPSKDFPFLKNGKFYELGLKNEQSSRFSVHHHHDNSFQGYTLNVNLTIQNITVNDSDVYVLDAKLMNSMCSDQNEANSTKTIRVRIPPGIPNCSFMGRTDYQELRELLCFALSHINNYFSTNLTCFQAGRRVKRHAVRNDDISQNDTKLVEGTFWIRPTIPVYCCSHFSDQNLSQDTCKSFHWAPRSSENTTEPFAHLNENVTSTPDDEQNTSTDMTDEELISYLVPNSSDSPDPNYILFLPVYIISSFLIPFYG